MSTMSLLLNCIEPRFGFAADAESTFPSTTCINHTRYMTRQSKSIFLSHSIKHSKRSWGIYWGGGMMRFNQYKITAVLFLLLSISATKVFADEAMDRDLITAIFHNDLTEVQKLITSGANPNNTELTDSFCPGPKTKSPPAVIYAARYDKYNEILKYLVESGHGDINVRSQETDCVGYSQEQRTPILETLAWGLSKKNFLYLLSKSADLNTFTAKSNASLLTFAMFQGDQEVIESLWGKVSKAVVQNTFEWTIAKHYIDAFVQKYTDQFVQAGIDLNQVYRHSSLVQKVVSEGSAETLKVIFNSGANQDLFVDGAPALSLVGSLVTSQQPFEKVQVFIDAKAKTLPYGLQSAVSWHKFPLAEYFISKGISVNSQFGGTPLIYLLDYQSAPWLAKMERDELQFLVDHGLDIQSSFNGETPLITILKSSTARVEVGAVLLTAGANPNVVDTVTGWTPLMLAVNYPSYIYSDLIVGLLKSGARADFIDKNGLTPLLLFLLHYNWQSKTPFPVFEALISASQSVINKTDPSSGFTALHTLVDGYFQYEDSQEIGAKACQFLLQSGADKNIKDMKNRTPLDIAMASHAPGIDQIIDILKK